MPDAHVPIDFWKMQGAGNDFVVVDGRNQAFSPEPDLVARLAHRRTGIGFDQLLLLGTPASPAADLAYRIFNADGSEVGQCGNGARCIALLAARVLEPGRGSLTLESPAGLHDARVFPDEDENGAVAIGMGTPDFRPASLPFRPEGPGPRYRLETEAGPVSFHVVSMGNPHAVIEVADTSEAPVRSVGAALNHHPAFPEGVNVGFLQTMDESSALLRVFERGAGETLACGTGACAAAASLIQTGRAGESVAITLPGGRLVIRWAGGSEPLWMQGDAQVVFEGRFTP